MPSISPLPEPATGQHETPEPSQGLLLQGPGSIDTYDEKPVKNQVSDIRGILTDWWQEMTAIMLSTMALVAIVLTLYTHNGQPLPEWPYSISINALIAIYTLVFKVTILFAVAALLGQLKWLWYVRKQPLHHLDIYDQASRGPLGSSKLLWSVGYHDLLASIGAIITMLMVVANPFTQLLISTYDCQWPVSNETSLIRTNALLSLGPGSNHAGAGVSSVPPNWQNAINGGLFTGAQTIPVTCATGNCTFPGTYATLGFCSICQDISDQLRITNESYTELFNGQNVRGWGYNASLPSGFSVFNAGLTSYMINWTSTSVKKDKTVEIILTQPPPADSSRQPINFANVFNLNDSACAPPHDSGLWWCRGYGAAACHLRPCVKRFQGSVSVGLLNETLLETSPNEQWGGEIVDKATLDLSCVSPQERSELETAGYHFSSNQEWSQYNLSYSSTDNRFFDSLSESLLANGCLYVYSDFAVDSLWLAYLNYFFTGILSSTYGPGEDPRTLLGPQYLQQIFNWGNISFARVSEIFTNISDSMTTVTRQSANYSDPKTGIVTRDQTCLKVLWPYISFPSALLAVVWSFLVATLFTQHKAKEVPAWKSSTLPLLFNGFITRHSRSASDEGGKHQMRDLEVLAQHTKAQLVETEGVIGLVNESCSENPRKISTDPSLHID